MSTVIDLSQATRENSGPKMGRLAELLRRGIPVPPGFVVIPEVFEPSHHRDEAFELEISAAYDRLCAGAERPVVVRSSAMDEDGATASFAGVYESYLGVLGTAHIADSVRACWSSLHSERAAAYRQQVGVTELAKSMAVGVLLMVPARSSGVAFTVDPATGQNDRMIIEASWGFGEPVVQGVVTPDRIEVADDGRVLRYEIGDKNIALTYAEDGRMDNVQLTPSLALAPALTTEEIAALADRVRAVAAVAEEPVDCEWVIDESGCVWIVQWRSVTALPTPAALLWDPAEYAARYAFRST